MLYILFRHREGLVSRQDLLQEAPPGVQERDRRRPVPQDGPRQLQAAARLEAQEPVKEQSRLHRQNAE